VGGMAMFKSFETTIIIIIIIIHNTRTANKCFQNVAMLNYLGTTVTNQNFIQEEIKSRLNSEIAYYRAGRNLLSSHLLSRNVKIKIHEIITLTVV
jgi:hypothetical protein